MIKFFFSLLMFISAILLCPDENEQSSGNNLRRPGYDLSSPDGIFTLPPSLHEISGITEVDPSSIACVQDEHGLVFIYDINKELIARQFIFGAEGDYEDITRVDEKLYVLRSDEVLIEISDFRSDRYSRKAYQVKIPGTDTESICYDRTGKRLLLVPKELPDKNSEEENRYIYAFDLNKKEISAKPAMIVDLEIIKKFAVDNSLEVPMKKKKGEKEKPDIKLQISAMGIHPFTNRLFAISGSERLLFVFDIRGNIEYIERLDKDLFPQPEGLTFMQNGDLFISNEGKNDLPTLIRFRYKPESNLQGNVFNQKEFLLTGLED